MSYLLGGLGNYVGAWLRRPAQAVEDGTAARTIVITALARAVAEKASADPELVEAALQQWAPAAMVRQANKARIAHQALESLREAEDKFDESRQIDDDFLNAFEKFCEDASSEKMQHLWARVLAGELKRPGSFSRSTLRFLYELDETTASAFEKISKHVLVDQVFVDTDDKKELFPTLLHLEAAGILTGAAGLLQWQTTADENGHFGVAGVSFGILALAEPNSTHVFAAIPLSKMGQEVASIVPNPAEEEALEAIARDLKNKPVKGVALTKVVSVENRAAHKLIRVLWGENPFPQAGIAKK